jgi:nucleotide-binding universal stress UspA family protein
MYRKLFVPVDGSELSQRAMQQSIDLARQLGAAISGFVVDPELPRPTVGTQLSDYERETQAHVARTDTHAHGVLAQFQELAAAHGVPFSGLHVHTALVGQAIADHAAEQSCDMIVMVTHGRGVFGELLFGSHTKTVLARSTLPLLILH